MDHRTLLLAQCRGIDAARVLSEYRCHCFAVVPHDGIAQFCSDELVQRDLRLQRTSRDLIFELCYRIDAFLQAFVQVIEVFLDRAFLDVLPVLGSEDAVLVEVLEPELLEDGTFQEEVADE